MSRTSILIACFLLGCTARLPSVESAIGHFRDAVKRDDPHQAWLLLSRSLRSEITEQQFAGRWVANRAELARQVESLDAAALRERCEAVTARDVTTLRKESAGWRLTSPGHRRAPSSPAAMLAAVANALEHQDLAAVLELLSEPLRAVMERDLGARVNALRGVLQQPLQSVGNRATIHYGDTYNIDIINDNGEWRIADFN